MKPKTFLMTILLGFGMMYASAQEKYVISPVPQQMMMGTQTVNKPETVTIVAGKQIDDYTINRACQVLTEHGIKAHVGKKAKAGQSTLYLGVNGSGDMADKLVTRWGLKREIFAKPKYDRHIFSLRKERNALQLVILGEHTDAVFCGLASLEQILDGCNGKLVTADIYDYADIKERGVIEGYYGVPYSEEVTEDLFRFMARYKMNTYMYGAKSDPYHSQFWDKPYPTTITQEQREIGYMTQDMLRKLTDVAHRCKVNFIWAIHPGSAFTDAKQPEVLDRIMAKFEAMHGLGVRQFGVFVDDVGVPDDAPSLELGADRLTQLQQKVDARWNAEGALASDTVKALAYVPQLYAYSWVSKEKAERFFRSLRFTPAKVSIYITGRAIWTVPNTEDPALVSSWLGREVAWWWNYPCNDNDMSKIFPMDTYNNFHDEKHIDNSAKLEPALKGVKTLISNPMQQGEVSKIALFGIADYSWNMAGFDNMRSWLASLPAVVGKERAEAFRNIAPYLRYYDAASELAASISAWEIDASKAQPLIEQLVRINEGCTLISAMENSANKSDRLFWKDISPWVLKLKRMTELALLKVREGKNVREAAEKLADTPEFQFKVLNGMGNDIQLSVLTAEPSAEFLEKFLKK